MAQLYFKCGASERESEISHGSRVTSEQARVGKKGSVGRYGNPEPIPRIRGHVRSFSWTSRVWSASCVTDRDGRPMEKAGRGDRQAGF